MARNKGDAKETAKVTESKSGRSGADIASSEGLVRGAIDKDKRER